MKNKFNEIQKCAWPVNPDIAAGNTTKPSLMSRLSGLNDEMRFES